MSGRHQSEQVVAITRCAHLSCGSRDDRVVWSRIDLTRKVVPTVDHKGEFRRVEVITGVSRRQWPEEVKARIMMESFADGAVISEVASAMGCEPPRVLQRLFGLNLAAILSSSRLA
jgi:Transposase